MIEVSIPSFFAIVFVVSACSAFAGQWAGRRQGMVEGYAALKWPYNSHFADARKYLNRLRARDGIATIEEECGK